MIQTIHGILLIVYIIVCVALTIIVLMQEGKQSGLSGALGGGISETYWGKNKGRSMEGGLSLATKILGALFIILSLLLNLKIFS